MDLRATGLELDRKKRRASDATLEILDLRHFAAPVLRPLLDAESEIWSSACIGTIALPRGC